MESWEDVTDITPNAFDAMVCEERLERTQEALRKARAEIELLIQERDQALYEVDRLAGR